MQKPIAPILIFLLLAASLSAEDDREILLDKEILYWRPQGADVSLPEVFYSPPLEAYPFGAWKTSLAPVLAFAEEAVPPESGDRAELSFSAPNWQPPGLSLDGEEQSRRNRVRLYASRPYGTGLLAQGGNEGFGYEIEGNRAADGDYPHWGRLALDGTPGPFRFRAVSGVRRDERSRLLTLFEGAVSLAAPGTEQSIGLGWKSDSPRLGEGAGESAWGVRGDYGLILFPASLQLGLGLEGEYLTDMSFPDLRLSPDCSLKRTFSLSRGDLVAQGGVLADIYPESPEDSGFFPSLKLSYLRYDDFSLGLNYANESIDEEAFLGFLLREPPAAAEFGFYRWHRASLSWAGRLGRGRASLEGGGRFGEMPHLEDGLLFAEDRFLVFGEAEWALPSGKGSVTEIMLYADYEDTGSLRFHLRGGWLHTAPSGRVYELGLRGGDRGIIRGYEFLLDDSSELLTGVTGGIAFSEPLKLEGNLDYVPRKDRWEGSLSLICRY